MKEEQERERSRELAEQLLQTEVKVSPQLVRYGMDLEKFLIGTRSYR